MATEVIENTIPWRGGRRRSATIHRSIALNKKTRSSCADLRDFFVFISIDS
ncbi:hypothetical protein GCM10011538_07500 [Ligilactobacillus murinus]